MNVIGTAYSGLQASMLRLNASASRIANASAGDGALSPNAAAQPGLARPNVDIVDEMVEQLSAKQSFEANASVIQRASDAEKSLFELWA